MKPMHSLLALLAAASLSSCLGESVAEEKGTVTYGGSSCVNYVTDRQTNESFVSTTPPGYKFEFNFTKALATIEVSNLQLAQNFSALSFQLPEMKAEPDYYYTKMQGTDIVPTNAASQYVFSSFSARYSNRVWEGNFYPVFQINYVVNSRYQVSVIPTMMLLFGTTNASPVGVENPTTYTYRGGENNIYNLQLSPVSVDEAASGATHTLNILIQNARFAEEMTATDMVITKLPVTINASGFVCDVADGANLSVKNYAGSEIEQVKVTRLRVIASTAAASLFEMDIKFDNHLGLDGTYRVTASIDNFIIDEDSDKTDK